MAKKLTAKEQAFVEAYAGDATHAAKLAGYGGNNQTLRSTGCRVLKRPHVQAALKKKDYSKSKRRIMSRDEILENLTMVAEDPLAAPRDRVSALEKLARANGMFTDKIISANLNTTVGLDNISDDQLNNIMAGTLLEGLFSGLITLDQAKQIRHGDHEDVQKLLIELQNDPDVVIDVEAEVVEPTDEDTKYVQ